MKISNTYVYAALLMLTGCATASLDNNKIIAVQNPVIDSNFPDPAAIKAADGYYYVYATQ